MCYFQSSQFSVLGSLNACIWCEHWKWWLWAYVCGNLSCGFKWGLKGQLSALFVTDRELISHTAPAAVSRLAVNIRQKCSNIYFCILFSYILTGPPHFSQSTFSVVIFSNAEPGIHEWTKIRNIQTNCEQWYKDLLNTALMTGCGFCHCCVTELIEREKENIFYKNIKDFDLIPPKLALCIMFLSVTPIGCWWQISSAILLYTEVLGAKHQGCLADTCHKGSIVHWLCWF